MFTLFKVFMAKCILITFISKRINKQASNHGMLAAHKLPNNNPNKYEMIMTCSQHINHKKAVQMSNHGMFAAHKLLKHQVWDDHGIFAVH
jgi:hypothetical protein